MIVIGLLLILLTIRENGDTLAVAGFNHSRLDKSLA